jgi:hypothetical protein
MALLAGKTVKTRRRKAAKAKPSGAQGPEPCDHSSVADLQEQLDRRTRERDEAREQQAATADVLKVISRSTFDLQTVLDTLTASAARLCEAEKGGIWQRDADVLRFASDYGFSREAVQYAMEHPLPVHRGSVTGRVALEGRPIHLRDVLVDPEYQATDYQQVMGYRTILAVPLLREGTTIGTFTLMRSKVIPFSEKQIELVTTFADQAVIAIENARLLNELRQRTNDLSESLEQQTATADVLRVISSSPGDLKPVFEAILENAVHLCGAKFGNLYLCEGDGLRAAAMPQCAACLCRTACGNSPSQSKCYELPGDTDEAAGTEVEPVFQVMLRNAARICEAKFSTLYLYDGDRFRVGALHNAPAAFAEFRRRERSGRFMSPT